MYYDSLLQTYRKICLCYDCAVEFMHDNPWLKEIIGDETAEEAKPIGRSIMDKTLREEMINDLIETVWDWKLIPSCILLKKE